MRHLISPAAVVATAAAFTVILPLSSHAAESAEIAALREQLRSLEQKLLVLERKQELKDEAAAASPAPVVTTAPTGFAIASTDRKYRLRLWANAHADGRFYLGDNVEGNDTFLIRRLRLSFEGNLGEKFAFRLMPDFAPATFNLLEAYVTYQHSPAFNFLVGKTKSPFDLERLVSQTDMLFIERGYPTSLGPNRDIGVQLFGDVLDGRLTYQLAWLNGARDNDTTITDTDDAKEVVARLFAHPFKNEAGSLLQGLGFGVAASTGEKNTGSPNSYRTNAQQTFFSWRANVVNAGKHERIEPQAYYYSGPLGLIGSWAVSKQALSTGTGTAVREIENKAWYAAASWMLTGEDASYNSVTPATSFSLRDGTWGAFEVAVRYGEFEIDDAAFPVFANPLTAAERAKGTTLGVNWFLSRNLKAQVNFEHTSFEGGAANPVTRENERAIFTRLQVRY
jgi:phosphate-selective porin OprO/OprP